MKAQGFKHQTLPITNERTINSVLDFKDYHISHNPSAADYGTETTAIVISNRVFFILCGDYHKPLRDAANAGGLSECLRFFITNIKQAHAISEHKQATGRAADPWGLMPTLRDAVSPDLFKALFDASI